MTINIKQMLQEAVDNITLDEDLGNLTVLPSQAQTAVKRALQDNAASKSMLTPNSKVSKIEYNDANDLIYKIRNRVGAPGYQGFHAAIVVAKSKTGIEGYVIFAFQKPLDYENASRFSSKADGLIYATTYTAAKRTFKEWQAKIVDSGEAWLIAIDDKVRAKQAERAANKPLAEDKQLDEGIKNEVVSIKSGYIGGIDLKALFLALHTSNVKNIVFVDEAMPHLGEFRVTNILPIDIYDIATKDKTLVAKLKNEKGFSKNLFWFPAASMITF